MGKYFLEAEQEEKWVFGKQERCPHLAVVQN